LAALAVELAFTLAGGLTLLPSLPLLAALLAATVVEAAMADSGEASMSASILCNVLY